MTYDDSPEICGIYAEYKPESFGLTYTAQTKRKGAEVIIHSQELHKTRFKPDVTFKEVKNVLKNNININRDTEL